MTRSTLLRIACALAATCGASWAPLGAQSPAQGFRLFGALGASDTVLMDVGGRVVQTWSTTFAPGSAVYLEPDGTLLRTGSTQAIPTLEGVGGALQRIALDGTLRWDWRYDGPGVLSHHDVEVLPNGNVLLLAWEEKTLAEAVTAGRDPALVSDLPFRPDHIIEVAQTGPTTGSIVWEWHAWDHLIQDLDPSKPNFGVVADHPERIDINYPRVAPVGGNWNRMTSIDYDEVFDRILVSASAHGEIWVIDHSTTTAEAAGSTGGFYGKGGDLLYRWGNPAAHGRGLPSAQLLFGQHGAIVIPQGLRGAGNYLVFNNGAAPGGSEVWEVVPPLDPAGRFNLGVNGRYGPSGPLWSYSAPGFDSPTLSSAERLPNGNTLICSGAQGWIFEVLPTGQIVWQHTTGGASVFHAHYVDRTLWVDHDELSLTAGGTVTFDLIAGSTHAGDDYLLLGSVSGTAPGIVIDTELLPLNFDDWTLTTVLSANVFPLGNTAGLLDAQGRARATFSLPPALLPPQAAGIVFDHAYVLYEPARTQVVFASNPERFVLVP